MANAESYGESSWIPQDNNHHNSVEPQGEAEVPKYDPYGLDDSHEALGHGQGWWSQEAREQYALIDDFLELDWQIEAHFYCKQNRSDEDQLEYQAWDDIRHGRTHFTHRYEGRGDDYRQMYFNARHRVEYFLKNYMRKLQSA